MLALILKAFSYYCLCSARSHLRHNKMLCACCVYVCRAFFFQTTRDDNYYSFRERHKHNICGIQSAAD